MAWAGAYAYHESKPHHKQSKGHGVLLTTKQFMDLTGLAKKEGDPPTQPTPPAPHPTNEQAAGVGVSTYAKHAAPFGTVNKGVPSNLEHYPMKGTKDKVNQLVKDHGYQVYYMGGKHGKPDLANRNYENGHLAIWDPSAGSGGDFGEEDVTDNWRKVHELAHALTLPALNQKYGEGRRMGGLGKHRTLREAKRSVEWEYNVAHKQRDLNKQLGIHVPDEVFHKELNTVMHDAVHRAVTGKFTESSAEGFVPHSHKVPLETSLGMLDEAAKEMGLPDEHSLVRKSEREYTAHEAAVLVFERVKETLRKHAR